MRLLTAGLTGIVMAFISAHYLFSGDARSVFPWAILALLVGLSTRNRREALYAGGIYGYILSFSFLWFDKSGPTSLHQFGQLMVVIGLVSLFGALCGLLLSWLAYSLKSFLISK